MVASKRTDGEVLLVSGALAGAQAAAGAAGAAGARPAISVVIPCYNGADTLGIALRSLRRQTFRAWEAIVVDDGSTDASAAVAARWAARDRRIRSLQAPHGGVSAAWNLGVAAARAPWLAFLDCDDWLDRNAFNRLLRLAAKRPDAGVVMGATCSVLPDGRRRPYLQPDLSDAFAVLHREGGIAIHSALVRRTAVLNAGWFDPDLGTHEDWDLWQRLARTGVRFAQTRSVVAFYRMRPGSLSRQVWRFAVDGLEVMNRGCGPDPRVARPHPAHAQGGSGEDLPMRRLCFTLWSAARDIAAGGDGLAIADLVAAEPRHEFDARELGQLMAAGMADMAACAPCALGPRWTEFAAKLAAILDRLYPGQEHARAKAIALGVIKAALNAGRAGDDDVIQLDRPRIPQRLLQEPCAVLQLRRGGRTLGAVALAALAPLGPATFAQMLAAQAGRLPRRATLGALRPWGLWPFWRAAVVDLLRPAPPSLITNLGGPDRLGELFSARLRTATSAGVRAAVAARLAGWSAPPGPDEHEGRLRALEAEAGSPGKEPPARPPGRSRPSAGLGSGHSLRVPILMYHRIAAAGGLRRYRVSPEVFAEQMSLLDAAGFTTLTPEALADGLDRGRPFAGRPVVLTFDDGYDDFYETAWPILRAHRFTATVFAVAGRLGQTAEWDAEYGPPASLMSAERLNALAREGISIGSHAFTHTRLTHLETGELYREALASAAILEQALGRRPTAFCYPYGALDPVVEQAVEICGYRLGFSVTPGAAALDSPRLRLPRLEVAGGLDLQAFVGMLG